VFLPLRIDLFPRSNTVFLTQFLVEQGKSPYITDGVGLCAMAS
jgi:hypothetical protein